MRLRFYYILLNTLFIVLAFLLVTAARGMSAGGAFAAYMPGVAYMLGLHLVVSLLFDKYNFAKRHGLRRELMPVLWANVAFTGLASILFVLLGISSVPRMVFFGTVALATMFELLNAAVVNHFRRLNRYPAAAEPDKNTPSPHLNGFQPPAHGSPPSHKALFGNGNGHGNGIENGNGFPAEKPSHDRPLKELHSRSAHYRPYRPTGSEATTKGDFSIVDTAVTEIGMQEETEAVDPTPVSFATIHGLTLRQSIIDERGELVFDYLNHFVPLGEATMVLSTSNRMNLLNMPHGQFNAIVNLQRVNDHRWLNKFFETVNAVLPMGGHYAGCCETLDVRKLRFFRCCSRVFGSVMYLFDYLLHRVAPKVNITQRLYFGITRGRNRVLSRAEVLGRLYCCGFRVVDERLVNGLLYFVVQKMERPCFDTSPTYGPLIKLSRIGQNGRIINVYKLRTMYPYAEYLQHYIFEKNKLEEGGKFSNDFRVSTSGRLMRKLWVDELPMILNLLRGDLKLVGVRPLSQQYFSLYAPEIQQLRIKTKPGLIPPYYADMPKTLEEIMESEKRYLEKHQIHPFRTDFVYFWKAFYNIIIRKARSK